MPKELQVPKASKLDHAHSAGKAALSLIPGVGGPAVELFQALIQAPLDRRRNEWMTEVGERLEELGRSGVDLGALQANPEFVTAVMHASSAAIRTHQKEKLEALRNAVINVARGQAPDETVQHLLLSFVSDLSEMHLRILKVFSDPKPDPSVSMGALNAILENAIPSLQGQRQLYSQLWRDLHNRGLVNTDNLTTTMTISGLAQRRTTELGEKLLSFISE